MRKMVEEGIRDYYGRLQNLPEDIENFHRKVVTTDDLGDAMEWFDDALEIINTDLEDVLARDDEGLRWAYEALMEAYGMAVMMSITANQDLKKNS